MAKLLDYYADVDDFEEGPLTLVNRSHPVNVKRDRQNVTRTIAVSLFEREFSHFSTFRNFEYYPSQL